MDILIQSYTIAKDGECQDCQSSIPGIWNAEDPPAVGTGESIAAFYSRLRSVSLN